MYNDGAGRVVLLHLARKGKHPLSQIQSRDEEHIRCLAFQAARLPSTLSKSEIEQLGIALLAGFPRAPRKR